METTRLPGTRKVGQVAAATGLTVRTLHYYQEIGLLAPSGRSEAGHRLYSAADLERLYRTVCSAGWGFRSPRSAGSSTTPRGACRRR